MRLFLPCLILLAAGCGRAAWYADYPFPALALDEKDIVRNVEAKIPAAIAKFNRPCHKSPIVCVVRTPGQWMEEFGCTWAELPARRGVPCRVPGEGYSGMWSVPVIYISTIGDRATLEVFRALYCHERAHTFGLGDGVPLLNEIEQFLYAQ